MTLDIATRVPQHGPETTGIPEAQNALAEDQVNVIMLARWSLRRHQAQAARHAEVENDPAAPRAAFAVQQQILAASEDAVKAQAGEPRREIGRNLVTQARSAHNRPENTLSPQ